MLEETAARVTPRGVRDGEPGVLAAVRDRRGPAVIAYCELVCAPGLANEAAAEAFSEFRAAVVAAAEPADLQPDEMLLSLTRRAASRRAFAPHGSTRLRGARRAGRSPCELIFELLVARAENRLTAADRDRLSRHLERCEVCRAAAQRFRAAELAYREPPPQELAASAADMILMALIEAAPVVSPNGSGAAIEAQPALEAPPVLIAPDAGLEPTGESPPATAHPAVEASPHPLPEPEDTGYLPLDAHAQAEAPHAADAPHAPETYAADVAPQRETIVLTPGAHDAHAAAQMAAIHAEGHADTEPATGARAFLMGGGRHLPRRRRRAPDAAVEDPRHTGLLWRLGVPAGVLLAALVAVLAVAGIFSPGGSSNGSHPPRKVTSAPVPAQVPPAPPAAGALAPPVTHRRHHHARRVTHPRRGARAGGPSAATPVRRAPTVLTHATPTPSATAIPTPVRTPRATPAPRTVRKVDQGTSSSGPSSPAPPSKGTGFQPGLGR